MDKLSQNLTDLKDLLKSAMSSKMIHPVVSTKAINKKPLDQGIQKPQTPKAPKAGQSLTNKDPKKAAESITNAKGIETKNAVKEAKNKKEILSFDGNGQWSLNTK